MPRLRPQQRAALLDVLQQVNAGEFHAIVDIPEWMLDWPLWSAGENLPGCLPENPYRVFHTERATRGYCRFLERECGGGPYVTDYQPITLREILA